MRILACADLHGHPERIACVRSLVAEHAPAVVLLPGDLTHVGHAPIPTEDHTERAVRMAIEMRTRADDLRRSWLKAGYDLSLAVGLAAGYATLGRLGLKAAGTMRP